MDRSIIVMQYEQFKDDRVLDTRLDKGANYIRRRRESLIDKKRYTTYEIREAEYKKLEKLEKEIYQLKEKLKQKNKTLRQIASLINKED